jgi:eukaryotic-like serine/threonine-protein kinase
LADLVNMQDATGGEDAGLAVRVGSVIKGKWTVDALLGVGGMAAVYAATHRNNQRAALKILHADFAREKAICERFLREAYVSNKVGHPATVQVLDDDQTESEEPFLVMELLEGQTVRDAWKKAGRAMPVTEVLAITEAVLDCLAACHAIGVIHRDLKPANIFLTNDGVVKVLDFGVAQFRSATAERTAMGTALGTPAYMSPEQAMGLVDQLDGRADIFSVGAMMHALITGQRINNGRTEQEALVMAATKPVPSVARTLPNLPIEIIQIVDKSLQWDRRNRYADAREMQASVTDALFKHGGRLTPRRAGQPGQALPLAPHQHAIPHHVGGLAQPVAPVAAISPQVVTTVPPPAVLEARRSGPQSVPTVPGRGGQAQGGAPQPPVVISSLSAADPADGDPRVQALRDLMKHFDRTLPSVRQLGWAHPATERALRTAFEAIADALSKDPRVMSFGLRPYSFTVGAAGVGAASTVWEPAPPYDAIPYNLFAAGLRTLSVDPGITMGELRELLTLFMLDPGRDLPPEDDIAAAFWERGLPHVRYESVDAFAEGDGAEREAFYSESDQVEAQAHDAARQHTMRVEAKAMVVSTDRGAFGQQRPPSVLALDTVVRTVFHEQLEVNREQWSERYIDALVEGYLDCAVNRDAPLVLASLRKSAADLVVAGRIAVVVQLQQAVVERLGQRASGGDRPKLAAAFTNALFGAEVLELTLKHLKEHPENVPSLQPILATLSGGELPTMLGALRDELPPPVRDAVIGFVERVSPGREAEIGAAATGLDADTACAIVGLLARATTPGARQALLSLANSEEVNVRIEAKVLVAGAEHAHGELAQGLESPSPLVRMAALRAIARHKVRGAWPAVARATKAADLSELGLDERREILRALIVVSPQSGEPMALELAKKGGVLLSAEREATRLAAIQALGEHSRSRAIAQALEELMQSRWGTSEETRAAAQAAARAILARAREAKEGGALG